MDTLLKSNVSVRDNKLELSEISGVGLMPRIDLLFMTEGITSRIQHA